METVEIIATVAGAMVTIIGTICALWKSDKFKSYLQIKNKIKARKDLYKAAINDFHKVGKEAIKKGDPNEIPKVLKELNKMGHQIMEDIKSEMNGKT